MTHLPDPDTLLLYSCPQDNLALYDLHLRHASTWISSRLHSPKTTTPAGIMRTMEIMLSILTKQLVLLGFKVNSSFPPGDFILVKSRECLMLLQKILQSNLQRFFFASMGFFFYTIPSEDVYAPFWLSNVSSSFMKSHERVSPRHRSLWLAR